MTVERRIGERRRGPRRFHERRRRPIPVAVDLRSGLDRRIRADRRQGSERRSDVERVPILDERLCDAQTVDGGRCGKPALVRGQGADAWTCLEHLVGPPRLDLN